MALFQVPGWSIPAAPVREASSRISKKRKRPSANSHKVESAEVNIEKLMSQLTKGESSAPRMGKDVATTTSIGHPKKKKQKRKETTLSAEPLEDEKNVTTALSSNPISPSSSQKEEKKQSNGTPSTKNKTKKQHTKREDDSRHTTSLPMDSVSSPTKQKTSGDVGLTALQKSMKDKLDGARFRLINENLYKSDSQTAHQMMREDPQVFEEYHTGFRHQVLSWPTNPVEHYISMFSSYPPKTVIADLGCGDAALAKGLLPRGLSVISFDLVSDNKYVVEADVCHKIPLPGSEGQGSKDKSAGEGQIVDAVVCALSLMGVNWVNSIREAWRILKTGGELHIAEVTSRFTDFEQFQNLLGSLGFRLKNKDDSKSSHFTLFEFVKVPRLSKSQNEWAKLLSSGAVLKPCEYKRR